MHIACTHQILKWLISLGDFGIAFKSEIITLFSLASNFQTFFSIIKQNNSCLQFLKQNTLNLSKISIKNFWTRPKWFGPTKTNWIRPTSFWTYRSPRHKLSNKDQKDPCPKRPKSLSLATICLITSPQKMATSSMNGQK